VWGCMYVCGCMYMEFMDVRGGVCMCVRVTHLGERKPVARKEIESAKVRARKN
jgi:hypothetical protein